MVTVFIFIFLPSLITFPSTSKPNEPVIIRLGEYFYKDLYDYYFLKKTY